MKSIKKIFNPEIFQGSPNLKSYFEGWYFKNVSSDLERAVAVIPGISFSEDPHSFIQFIDGVSRRTTYFRYAPEQFRFSKNSFHISIGDSEFSTERIILNLTNNKYRIEGTLQYTDHHRLPKSILMPGIMGWYSYVPGMECNHGVVSANHNIEGTITINNSVSDFTGGNGYIEKDWGISFPESWLWLQCNNFEDPDISVMVSVAKIPWRGRFFIGLISFFATREKTEIFASYNGAGVISLKRVNANLTEIVIRKGRKELALAIQKSGSGTIVAPANGKMTNMIKESISSEVDLRYTHGGSDVFTGRGKRAGYEEMEKIFTYF